MIAEITYQGARHRIDLARPLDLSLPLHAGPDQLRAWWVDPVRMEPVRDGDTVYAVRNGAPVNFFNVFFNPHGHGTHTESVGHIAPERIPVGGMLDRSFFTAEVISITPEQRQATDGKTAQVITSQQLRAALGERTPEAVIIRTLPNAVDKQQRDWSGSNAAYMEAEGAAWLRERGVLHLLLDLPSVDREEDHGALAAHHAFWAFPQELDLRRTITELLFVPDHVSDGRYFLDLQFPHFVNDAAPSRPVLYALLP